MSRPIALATAWERVRLDLETERLSLRSWMATDTAWHRHLVAEHGGAIPTLEDGATVIAGALAADRDHGVVPSVVVRREEGDVIGYCGLVVGRATIDEPELAFELRRAQPVEFSANVTRFEEVSPMHTLSTLGAPSSSRSRD